MSKLKLNHIYKVYSNGVKAVNDFSMEIEDKEFIVFVGPSGCGKSTTLRMIAGIEEITAGELYIGDEYMNYVAPKNRDIAMVFQNYALYPHMTVYDNMAFGLKLRHLSKEEIDRRIKEAANILGITEYLDRKPNAMSGGQRQRVALGRAIVREPKVFLLDEPLSNLDAKLRTAMRAEISKLHRRLQTTFIYVTHDQTEAMTMGTRIVVMKDGYIQQIDTPSNLYRYPCNQFVAGFIGTPQMNFFAGKLVKEGDHVKVLLDGTDLELSAPAQYFRKVNKKYLTGDVPVTIGIRAEHITTNTKEYPHIAKCRIMNVEELGVNDQVYADFNLEASDLSIEDSATKLILRAPACSHFAPGEVVDVAINLNEMHVFDQQTGESVIPRIPKFAQVVADVADGKLCIDAQKIALPSALAVENGACELEVPTSAVKIGGSVKAKIIDVEDVNGTTLLTLSVGDQVLFATDDKNSNYQLGNVEIDIDLKQITLLRSGETIVNALPEVNVIDGSILKEKVVATEVVNGKERKVKKTSYSMFIGGHKFLCSPQITDEIFSHVNEKICGCALRFNFQVAAAKIAQDGMQAVVEKVLDYGTEKYALAKVGETQIVVKLDGDEVGEEIAISVAPEDITVVEPTLGIRLF